MKGDWRKFDTEISISTNYKMNDGERFDALFISTKNNARRVYYLVKQIRHLGIAEKIFVIPSTERDIPETNVRIINIHKEFIKFTEDYATDVRSIEWDIPYKRNFSIWFSKTNSFNRILLLDDDIRFTNLENSAYSLYPALNDYWMAGAYSIGEIDTSLIGGVAMELGIIPPYSFLSGSCLAISIDKYIPFFPDIYNEDWLSFLPAVIAGKATIVGPVTQLKRKNGNRTKLAMFQEFGEVLADELYSHVARPCLFESLPNIISTINNVEYWNEVLKDRAKWLRNIEEYICEEGNGGTDLCIVRAALSKLSNITATDCVYFIHKWQQNVEQWLVAVHTQTKYRIGDY